MAHKEQQDFCKKIKVKYPDYFTNKNVLDIGSLDINGSNKEYFENCNYIGLDVGEGKNVDVVSVGHLYDGPDNHFDVIIATEVFEHDMFYVETFKNVIRMLKPGGLFLFTCASIGRPEHGTRRQGEWAAPLLSQISEDWGDYYKNLTHTDIKDICGFNEAFPDGVFEYGHPVDGVMSDLYFYGFKNGEKYLIKNKSDENKKIEYRDHIFIVDSWPNNKKKEDDLIALIKLLRSYEIEILLTGHYPIKPEIQNMVDYYIFDKKNPILKHKDFDSFNIGSGRWSRMSNHSIENAMDFHHDYAIWTTLKNSINFANCLNKKYIHFLEYDNLPDELQYRQGFLEKIWFYDAIIYEYNFNSSITEHLNPYCATYIFSIKTDIAIKTISQINSIEEYFKNRPKGWQLERIFLDCLNNVTKNIHVSEYIANNNELNKQEVWNRDGVLRNGAYFQIYLACDDKDDLYVHLISGFSDKQANQDYLIELNYLNYEKFTQLNIGNYKTIKIGKYKKGHRVKSYYMGVEIFNEFLDKDVEEFRKLNKLTWDLHPEIGNDEPTININFVDGPFVEVLSNSNSKYEIQFINSDDEKIHYETTINENCWSRSNLKYFVNWKIVVKNENRTNVYKLSLKNKRVFICFESKSLGDNIAWMPYVEKFKEVHDCHVICSTFHNNLFRETYTDIEFVEPGNIVNNIHALYRIGLFMDENKNIDTNKHPNNPRVQPLSKIASDILGLEYIELKPRLPNLGVEKHKRVCIGVHSTAQCKYWNNKNGWQEVVDFLNSKGYEVLLLSKEPDGYMGNKDPKNVKKLTPGSVENLLKIIQESEFFIGISSGLSWLSWASGTPTVLISGFTDDYLEPTKNIIRIINKNVCHGCWHTHSFDAGDWNWCPVHKGTKREFECSKEIKSSDVIEKLTPLLS